MENRGIVDDVLGAQKDVENYAVITVVLQGITCLVLIASFIQSLRK